MGLDCCTPTGSASASFSGAAAETLPYTVPGVGGSITPSWDTVFYDTDNYFDLAAHPTRITPPVNGKYRIGGNVFWEDPSLPITGPFTIRTLLNSNSGGVQAGDTRQYTSNDSGIGVWTSFHRDIDLLAGDFFTITSSHTGAPAGQVAVCDVWIELLEAD